MAAQVFTIYTYNFKIQKVQSQNKLDNIGSRIDMQTHAGSSGTWP